MTEKLPDQNDITSKSQKTIDVAFGEAPAGVDVNIYEEIKSAITAYFDRETTFSVTYDYIQTLIEPKTDGEARVPNEVTRAFVQRELDLMWASYL